MSDDEKQSREKELHECLVAVMYATPDKEIEAVRNAVTLAVKYRWLGATAAVRAARLLDQGAALEAARLLVPAGWSVAVGAMDLRAGPSATYRLGRRPGGIGNLLS
jgi:hypothetical protein